MIPTEEQARLLWEKYRMPERKRRHSALVCCVALFLEERLSRFKKDVKVNTKLLAAAALTHDIDKNAVHQPGERHPDAAVRILTEEGMDEVAHLVKTHPLHAMLDPHIMPNTWEEKMLYLADKMVKHDVVGVDQRFALWRAERLPKKAIELLDATYPKVKALEEHIFALAHVSLGKIQSVCKDNT